MPLIVARSIVSFLRRRTHTKKQRHPAAEQRDEVASFHCPIPPVLPTDRIAHLSRDCCAAGFRRSLCRLWVNRYRSTRSRPARNVRFTSNSGQTLAPQRNVASCHLLLYAPQQTASLFGYLIGKSPGRPGVIEHPGRSRVDDQFELARLNERQIH